MVLSQAFPVLHNYCNLNSSQRLSINQQFGRRSREVASGVLQTNRVIPMKWIIIVGVIGSPECAARFHQTLPHKLFLQTASKAIPTTTLTIIGIQLLIVLFCSTPPPTTNDKIWLYNFTVFCKIRELHVLCGKTAAHQLYCH